MFPPMEEPLLALLSVNATGTPDDAVAFNAIE